MIKIPNKIYTYISSIRKVTYDDGYVFLSKNSNVYCYVPVSMNEDVYSYLNTISFYDYYRPINDPDDPFELFLVDSTEKGNGFPTLASLYQKSAVFQDFLDNQKNNIFQTMMHQFRKKFYYYHEMQNRIEEMLFPRKVFYDLIINISDFYHMLDIGKYFLTRWNNNNPNKYFEVLTLRRLSPINFLNQKICDFSFSKRDYYVYELANYYQKYFQSESVLYEIDNFLNSFSISLDDCYLFYALISIPPDWDDEENIPVVVSYVKKTYSFLLEKQEENQEREEPVFQK